MYTSVTLFQTSIDLLFLCRRALSFMVTRVVSRPRCRLNLFAFIKTHSINRCTHSTGLKGTEILIECSFMVASQSIALNALKMLRAALTYLVVTSRNVKKWFITEGWCLLPVSMSTSLTDRRGQIEKREKMGLNSFPCTHGVYFHRQPGSVRTDGVHTQAPRCL